MLCSILRRLIWLSLLTALLAGCDSGDSTEQRAVPAEPAAAVATATTPPKPANPRLILATTTSTVDSGLLDALLPVFQQQSGYTVVPLSLGSGQALATAERGEADVLLVHSPDAEKKFVEAGHGIERKLVMHNDFVVVGPANDPAALRGIPSAKDAMAAIAAAGAPFISRGDNSGTHALELKLWKLAGTEPKGQRWYTEAGAGMGQTLQIANERRAYTIADRSTFLAQKKNLSLGIVLERDPALLNVYHVIQVSPTKNGRMNAAGARAFADFLLSAEGQRLIGEYGAPTAGEPLFVPDAGKDPASLGL